MIDKELLEQINSIENELQDVKERIIELNHQPNQTVVDSVQGSSTSYPYIKHSCTIEGSTETFKNRRTRNKYKKMIKNKEYKLEKLKTQLEYELNYIEDSEIRQIIRYKYEDNLSWVQVMFKMNYSSESTAKMKIKRFLEKNNKCDKCDDKT